MNIVNGEHEHEWLSISYLCRAQRLFDEVSIENNASKAIKFSNSSSDSSLASVVSDSPVDFRSVRDDIIQDVFPSVLGLTASERENRLIW